MSSANLVSLGDHISTQKGFAFKSSWYTSKGKAIVKVTNFTDSSIEHRELSYIPESVAAKYSKYALEDGDVVIQTVGSWPSNPASVVGKCIKVPQKVSGALLNQNAVKVMPGATLDNSYLFYLLKDDRFKNYIVGTAQGAASQAAITLDSIRAFKFPLTSLSHQRKIAGTLSSYDDLIENNMQRIGLLEEMARLQYEYLKSKPEADDWDTMKLSDLCTTPRIAVMPANLESNTVYIGLEHIPRRSLAYSSYASLDGVQSLKLKFESGDILFSKIRPYFHKVAPAPVAGVASSDTIIIRPISREFYALVLLAVFSDDFTAKAVQSSNGTKMPRANWDVLKKYEIQIPNNEELVRFNKFVMPIIDLIINLSRKNMTLKASRDLLLPRAISGEIEV